MTFLPFRKLLNKAGIFLFSIVRFSVVGMQHKTALNKHVLYH